MSESAAVDHYLAEFKAQRAGLPGRDRRWVEQIRTAALDRFRARGFPTVREEHWKYTRVSAIEKHAFRAPAATAGEIDLRSLEPHRLPGDGCCRLVFVDGRYCAGASSTEHPAAGVSVMSMTQALTESPDALEAHLGHYAGGQQHPFTALNTAFMADGAFVHLERGALAEDPIELLFVSSGREADVVSHPRVLVVAEVASRAAVIERYVGLGDAVSFTNAVTEVVLKAGACVEHYKIELESDKAFHVATIQAEQADESHFTSHAVAFGGRLVRHDINARLGAEDATVHLNGLFFANGRQHMDFHTRVDHLRPHGTSVELYKCVLDGRARGVFNGQAFVHPDAQKTDARQTNNNLLLSPHAEVDTKPQLEIHADDVKCAHGATVGQLDENMVFYLRSRGIDEPAARALLTYGFAKEMLDRIPITGLREKLTAELIGRLPHAEQLRGIVQ